MACAHCDDTGWKPIDDPTTGVRRVVRCDCWREQAGQHRLTDANIPARYLHCTFANFSAYNESLERALEVASRIPDRFDRTASRDLVGRGLFLDGQPGVGKTHLAVAAPQANIARFGAGGRFYGTRGLGRVHGPTHDAAVRT